MTASSKIQCRECGGVSTATIGESKLLHCPRCHALTSRWAAVSEKATSSIENCINRWRRIVPV